MTVRQLLIRTLLVAILAVVAAAIAYAVTASKPKEYQATSQLLFSPRSNPLVTLGVTNAPLDQGSAIANNLLDLSSFDVARATANALDDPRFDADTVANDVKVASVGGDEASILAQAESPQDAARLSNTYMHQFLRIYLARTIRQTKTARSALIDALNKLPPDLKQTVRGDDLRQQIGQLDVFLRTGNQPLILQHVRAKSGAVGPPVSRNTLFGLLFGAVLGIGLVAARQAMRPAPREY